MADSEQKNSKQPPWHQANDLENVSFGTWLRRQRDARGIELREIADHTKIGIRYLEALEQDRFDVLPAPVFTKGFLRQYGRYIGLDPDQVVNTYLNALQEGDAMQAEEPGRSGGGVSRRLIVVIVVIAVLVALAVAGYFTMWLPRRSADPAEQAPVPVTVPEPEPEPPTPVADESLPLATVAPLVVTLDFVDDSWLETVVDGERQLSEQVAKGESRRILAQERVVMNLGNARGVRVEVNGVPHALPEPAEGGELRDVEFTLEVVSEPSGEAGS